MPLNTNCRDLNGWPRSWMGLEKDVPPGEQLLALFRPFLEHLAASDLSPKTIQKHTDLARISRALIGKVEALDPTQRVVLDMDSTEIPVYGEQENSAYNGHFESTCYHPLLLFNRQGDCLAAKLRPGNVHSADEWGTGCCWRRSDAAVVRKHGAADRGAAGADGVKCSKW